ncbi:ATM interactor [Alosa sapidissima]|uniref:ATM interactor n=1 Tax=Alosa sapidissima TaxID=34773 RepID=UPI001C08DDC9|nr:ATM interactor [Alosa sapidissima]
MVLLLPYAFSDPGRSLLRGNMAASASEKPQRNIADNGDVVEEVPSQSKEIIKPDIAELTKEVRTNILCTVEGCGKILPNTPALNMHLVKSHRVKDGIVNPTVRKDMKGPQKLYCCPIEGCPRGPNRPFSQFSLVKQHFMKMHTEKKHKCVKCSNSYSTEWDLRRHAEDCGRTYSCTCGCPYASRAALLSHTYRTGHEIPDEHRYPPVKKRKMERMICSAMKVRPTEQTFPMPGSEKELSEGAIPTEGACQTHDTAKQNPNPSKSMQKLLLPKPKVALVNVPVMHLAHLPVLLPSGDSSALRSVILALDTQGSLSTYHLIPQSYGAVVPTLNTKNFTFKDTVPYSRPGSGVVSTGVQVCMDSAVSPGDLGLGLALRGKSTSTDIQTDISYLKKGPSVDGALVSSMGESSVSSCSQTDISVSAQVLLPVSVQTQTFPARAKTTSSIAAQTETHNPLSFQPFNITRETQTNCVGGTQEEKVLMNQSVMCSGLFDSDSPSVSTQTVLTDIPFRTGSVHDHLSSSASVLYSDKTEGPMCFEAQTDNLNQSSVADNQTQTMTLLNDLENILSDGMGEGALENDQTLSVSAVGCGPGLEHVQENSTGIDFDLEEFLSAAHIQTQTEESDLGGLSSETQLELLDIETQTDFLLLDKLSGGDMARTQSNDLEMEMFDTQTQTDLNFILNPSGHMPLGNILRQSSFNISTESSDNETQTDIRPPTLPLPCTSDGQVRLSSAETQTVTSSFDSLGHLFLTSNETQTVVDDFMSADLAWNMESHFSSVETQTCEELFSLFQHSEKPNS